MNLITKSTLALTLTLGVAVLASLSTLAQNPGRPNRFLPPAGAAGAAVGTSDTAPAPAPAPVTRPARPARPVPPLIAALDANSDGVIDAAEIANAATALKTLDTDGDGKLSLEELRPARPEGAPSGGRGRGPGTRGHGPRDDAPETE